MSIEAMARILNHCTEEGATKLVLLGIANHDGDGGSWPSIKTLARYASVTPRSVSRILADLVERGLITREVGEGGSAKTPVHARPNLYTLVWGRIKGDDPGVTPCRDGARDDVGVIPPLTRASSEPSVEPSVGSSPASPTKNAPARTSKQAQSDAVELARLFWDVVKADGLADQPSMPFPAIVSILSSHLKAGYTRPEIADFLNAAVGAGRISFTAANLEQHVAKLRGRVA